MFFLLSLFFLKKNIAKNHQKKKNPKKMCLSTPNPQLQCTNECRRERQVVCQDHRGKTSDQCPLHMEPHKSEPCCRWRANWKPV